MKLLLILVFAALATAAVLLGKRVFKRLIKKVHELGETLSRLT